MSKSKLVGLLPLVILSLSLVVFGTASAQSVPAPAIPDFSVAYLNNTYYVPLTSSVSTNPYTGEQITKTQGGYYIQNKTINFTIVNQPFTSTTIDGNTTHLYYEIRWKGHYENWTNHFLDGANWYSDQPNFYYNIQYGIQASNSDYTVVSWNPFAVGIPDSGKVDFEVKAQVGYTYLQYGNHAHIMPIATSIHFISESDWSNSQTLTLNKNENSTSTSNPGQEASSTPTVPELPASFLVPLFVLVAIAAAFKFCPLNKGGGPHSETGRSQL